MEVTLRVEQVKSSKSKGRVSRRVQKTGVRVRVRVRVRVQKTGVRVRVRVRVRVQKPGVRVRVSTSASKHKCENVRACSSLAQLYSNPSPIRE